MNQHIQNAVSLYDRHGESFAGLIPWHTVHGVVSIDYDHVLLAHIADHGNLLEVDPTGDTLFISYFGGIADGLVGRFKHLEFIAYERLRGGCVRIHPMMDFINKFTTKQGHGKQT